MTAPLLKRELSFCSKFVSGVTFAAIMVRTLFYYHIEKSEWTKVNEDLNKFHLINCCLSGESLIAMVASVMSKGMENEIIQGIDQHVFEPLFAPLITFVACALYLPEKFKNMDRSIQFQL
jgi:hypothetical protein